jgi:hypothetical protein
VLAQPRILLQTTATTATTAAASAEDVVPGSLCQRFSGTSCQFAVYVSKENLTLRLLKDTNRMKNKLKPSILVLGFLVGMLSVSVSYGQTVQRNTATRRIGPTITSARLPGTRSLWSWPDWRISQPRIEQQRLPYRTYWTNPDPNRIFPRLTKQAVADLLGKS